MSWLRDDVLPDLRVNCEVHLHAKQGGLVDFVGESKD